MGTGKSKVMVDGLSSLYLEQALAAVVVVAPNTVKSVWGHPEWGQIAVHTGNVPYHIELCAASKPLPQLSTLAAHKGKALVWIIVNYEAARLARFQTWLIQSMQVLGPVAMVLDEASKIKNGQAQQTKALMQLGVIASRRYILTGSPVAKNPLDLYAQMKFLSDSILKIPSYTAFRNKYAQMGGYCVHGRPVQIIGWKNLEDLKTRIRPYTRRMLKTECLDLPKKTYQRREVEMGAEQAKAYQEMARYAVAELPGVVDRSYATIALTKILRLSQITAGFLPVEAEVGTERYNVPFKTNPKLDELMQIIEETEHVVVFCMFREEITVASALLRAKGIAFGCLDGSTALAERTLVMERFQHGELQVVLAQVVTGGIGITLTKAHVVVYLTNPYSWEARSQSEDRVHRPGQKENVTYIDILATIRGKETIDKKVLQVLEDKRNLSEAVLDRRLEEFV